jgi:hypothetical protein
VILLLAAAAWASDMVLPTLTEEAVRPQLAAALDCARPHILRLQPVAELPEYVGWATARCGGSTSVVMLRENAAEPLTLAGKGPEVHGFLDLAKTSISLERVGEQIHLSAGPHGQRQPGLVVRSGKQLAVVHFPPAGATLWFDQDLGSDGHIEIHPEPLRMLFEADGEQTWTPLKQAESEP